MAKEEITSICFDDMENLEEAIREIKACTSVVTLLESTQGVGEIAYEEELYFHLYKMLQNAIDTLEQIKDGSKRAPHNSGGELIY